MTTLQIASALMAIGFCYCASHFFYLSVSRRDRIYGSLALAFLLIGLAQALSAIVFWPNEPQWLPLVRFIAFLVMIAATLRLHLAR